jgi:hypothetical protein
LIESAVNKFHVPSADKNRERSCASHEKVWKSGSVVPENEWIVARRSPPLT